MNHLNPFYFLRHGQTDWNLQRRCQGQTDIPLNATGINQAQNAKALLADIPIATICASPLGRARQTAEIINEELNCPLVLIEGLQEIGFGSMEGQPFTHDSHNSLIADAQNWGGEKLNDFVDRVVEAVEEASTYPGPVLIVAHGGAYWAIRHRLGIEVESNIANGLPVLLKQDGQDDKQWVAETVPTSGKGAGVGVKLSVD